MRTSKPGNSVYLEVGFWYDEAKDLIHIASKDVKGFHTTVGNDATSVRGHPNLFGKLAKCLEEAGAPHPKAVSPSEDA